MLQKDQPEDFVIATGESRTVREFFETAARLIGFKIRFEGKGQDEVAKDEKGKIILKIDPKYYRKAEVDSLLGDASKAYKELGWKPKTSFEELVRIMLEHDRDEVRAMAAKKR